MNQLVFIDLRRIHDFIGNNIGVEHSQTSKLERYTKLADNFQPSTIFAKHPIIDFWQGSEYAFVIANKIMPRVFVNRVNLIIYCFSYFILEI